MYKLRKIGTGSFIFALLYLFAYLLSNPVYAGRVENLYDVAIDVPDESSTTREKAFVKGLQEVFIRISGDSAVMQKIKLPSASRYIKRFSYDPIEKPVVNDDDELLTYQINIQYNGSAMQKYLLENGVAAWGEYRSDVIIWLVVRDGRNEYVLKEIDQSRIKSMMTNAMSRRGVPDIWPMFDDVDKKILQVSDIRGGFKDPVEQASKRYTRGPALTGSLIWDGRQWQSSWSLLLKDGSRHWSLNAADHQQLIDRSVNQAADFLGEVYAVHTTDNNQTLSNVWLSVQNINSIENYRYVENYLNGLNTVKKASPSKVDGEKTVFEVLLRSNEDDFINQINNDAELSELDSLEIEALQQQLMAEKRAAELTATGQIAEQGSETKQSGATLLATDKENSTTEQVKAAGSDVEQPNSDFVSPVTTGAADRNDTYSTDAEAIDSGTQSPEQLHTYYFKLGHTRTQNR